MGVCTTKARVVAVSDETVVESDGVTVSKFFNAEDFPVPAVAFDVSSSRDDPVELRIVDEIPDEFGIDQIGFHPEYGSEHWTASGDGVVRFEREIEAGETFTTVYGVRMEDGQDETPFLSAPTVQIDGEDIDDVVPPESTDVVRELAGGERDTVPGLEDDQELEAEVGAGGVGSLEDDDAEILEGDVDLGSDDADDAEADASEDFLDTSDDPVESEETDESPAAEPDVGGVSAAADPEPVTETPEVDAESPASSGFDAGDVAGALAEAIRRDEVSDEDMETLDEAFGGLSNSTEVEIDHLQSRVSELEAYTDALEAFLDENGPAQDLLSELEADVASLSEDLGELDASVENAADERETLRERVADVEADFGAVGDLEDDLDRLRGDVEALDERVADTENAVFDVEDTEDDLDDLEEHVDEIEEWRNQLSDVFGT
jgi:peptidoglycan hydrolase CwlO-like protein